jgi:hypothetical protein
MRCPSCKEETFEEELIAGKCPLCGSKIMDSREPASSTTSEPFIRCITDYDESPLDLGGAPVRDIIEDIFEDIFSNVERTLLISYMAYDISQNTGLEIKQARNVARQVVDLDEAAFEFEVIPAWHDEFKLKKCSRCGKMHLMIGRKVLKGRIEDGVGEYDIEYVCRRCA